MSLLLLLSAFLIKLNRLLPKDGASVYASYTMFVNPNTTQQLSHIPLFFLSHIPFSSIEISPKLQDHATSNTASTESLLNPASQMALTVVTSQSLGLSMCLIWIMSHVTFYNNHPYILGTKLLKGKDAPQYVICRAHCIYLIYWCYLS